MDLKKNEDAWNSLIKNNDVPELPPRKKQKRLAKVTQPALENRMQNLLNSGTFSDVTIIVEGKEFQAHRSILATCSSVFEAMFNQDTLEKRENRIVIKDFTYEITSQLLKYIYTNKIDKLSPDQYFNLLRAADHYNISELRKICSTGLKDMTIDLVIPILVLADLQQENELKESAILKLLGNPTAVMGSEDWCQFLKSHTELANIIIQRLAKMKVPTKAVAKKTIQRKIT